MEFEWDFERAAANANKHGVEFAEAMTVFGDPLELTISDPNHSVAEQRFLSIGKSAADRLPASGIVRSGEPLRKAQLMVWPAPP